MVLDLCDDAPAPHEVDISALIRDPGSTADAGAPLTVESLITVADDDGDGLIDTEEINPFLATIPSNEDITLRFVVRSTTLGGCVSGTTELSYRTGPPRP